MTFDEETVERHDLSDMNWHLGNLHRSPVEANAVSLNTKMLNITSYITEQLQEVFSYFKSKSFLKYEAHGFEQHTLLNGYESDVRNS